MLSKKKKNSTKRIRLFSIQILIGFKMKIIITHIYINISGIFSLAFTPVKSAKNFDNFRLRSQLIFLIMLQILLTYVYATLCEVHVYKSLSYVH